MPRNVTQNCRLFYIIKSRDLPRDAVREGVYPLDLVVEVEMVEAPHLLLLEPNAVPVPVQTAVVQGLLLSEDVLPGQLLLLLLLRQLVLMAVAVGRLLREAVGGWQQALQRGIKQCNMSKFF
jgi:hypothetical protein